MKYTWGIKDTDAMFGVFDSVEEAMADAVEYAKVNECSIAVEVWDTTEATPEERNQFIDEGEPGPGWP